MNGTRSLTDKRYMVQCRLEDSIANDDPRAHAIYSTLNGLNSAERGIEEAAYWLQTVIRDAERGLQNDRNLNSLGLVQAHGLNMDRNIALRAAYWEILIHLLTEAEMDMFRTERAIATVNES